MARTVASWPSRWPATAASDELAALAAPLRAAGQPVIELTLPRPEAVGAEFVRWEVATAALGIVLEVDPFDQPNVAEAKAATEALLDEYRSEGAIRTPVPNVAEPGLARGWIPRSSVTATVAAAVRSLLGSIGDGDYFAILAYRSDAGHGGPEQAPGRGPRRDRRGDHGRDRTAIPPFHRPAPQGRAGQRRVPDADGGAQRDLPIPGRVESFGTLVAAQAAGDFAALQVAAGASCAFMPPTRLPASPASSELVEEAVGQRRPLGHHPQRTKETSMQVGIVGLGRIGAGMARRLARGGHQVVAWNRTASVATDLAAEAENDGQVTAVDSVEDLVRPGRATPLLLSLPAGERPRS